MKYKVGDKVRVREDLEADEDYGFYFNKEMAKLKGKVVKIVDLNSSSYAIREDPYSWTEEMFSGLADEPINLMPLIVKELGVEIGEEFEISNKPDIYKFTEDGLMGMLSNCTYDAYSSTFYELISGKEKIIKLPQKPKLTEDEKGILRSIPEKYKYIAREDCGALYIYENKPKKDCNVWLSNSFDDFDLFQHLFQFIKWEDSEAYNIEELLKGE